MTAETDRRRWTDAASRVLVLVVWPAMFWGAALAMVGLRVILSVALAAIAISSVAATAAAPRWRDGA